MTRQRVAPFRSGERPPETAAWGSRYVYLTDDPETGGWTRLLIAPAGRTGGATHTTDFEYHTPQEEIFVLGGTIEFGDYYRVAAPAYLNHPPYWLHPAEQRFDRNVETPMLIRLSKPIDTFYVPIPDGWDGREYYAGDDGPPRGIAVSHLQLDGVPYGPVLRDGEASGDEAGVLWENPAENLVTWLWRIPPGWRGRGDAWRDDTGYDELYVVSGDLMTSHDGQPVELVAGSYYCSPDAIEDAGSGAFSESGLFAIRWSRPTARLTLPPILHSGASE